MPETTTKQRTSDLTSQLPVDRLKQEAQGFAGALTHRGIAKASESVGSVTDRLNDYASGNGAPKMAEKMAEGDSPVTAGLKATVSKAKDTVKEKLGGIGGGGGDKIKVTNIVESVDVPVSREVAYQQWTLFEDFPDFMKKVENVEQEEDEKVRWRAQIFWSHRTWESTIVDQAPHERIVWRSDGEKGHVDGAVTFHELAPDLTRIQLVLEYHPKGLFERTGNLWRAQGRRARLELKHFARHVASQAILHQDEIEGWRGEIRDGHVVEGDADQGDLDQDSDEKGRQEDRSSRDGDGGRSGQRRRGRSKKTSASSKSKG